MIVDSVVFLLSGIFDIRSIASSRQLQIFLPLCKILLNKSGFCLLYFYLFRHFLKKVKSYKQLSTKRIVILKIAFVAVLFGDNSWRFFNENLFNLFISGSSYLINVMSGTSFGNEETDFAFVDNLLGRFGKSFT